MTNMKNNMKAPTAIVLSIALCFVNFANFCLDFVVDFRAGNVGSESGKDFWQGHKHENNAKKCLALFYI